jgi:hypothetical protein
MRTAFIDGSQEESLTKRGYVVTDFLEPEELQALRHGVKELGFGRNSIWNFKDRLRVSVTQASVEKRGEIFDMLSRILRGPVARRLEEYRILRVAIFDKLPGGRGVRVHQHANLVDESRFRSLTIWVPLTDTTQRMGTLNVIDGSHAFSRHVRSYDDFYCAFDGISNELIRRYSTPLPMKERRAVVFDDRLIHWSPRNRTTRVRTAIQLELIPREASLGIYYRTGDRELRLYAIDDETYRVSALAAGKPAGFEPIGTLDQASVRYSDEQFLKMAECIRPGGSAELDR